MSTKKLTYAEAIAEVEQIVARLRSAELGVDVNMARRAGLLGVRQLGRSVARATGLIDYCRKQLVEAEAEVEKLIAE